MGGWRGRSRRWRPWAEGPAQRAVSHRQALPPEPAGRQENRGVTINAVTAMAATENEAALREVLAHYVARMRGLRLPAELGELLAVHGTCEEDALQLFMQRSFKDEGYTYQKRLMPSPNEAIKESYRRSLGQNEAASKDSCRALLETLSAAMQRSQGLEVLEQFLASKRIEAETVLNVDKNLTEAEKDLAKALTP
ncbi:unnamed protein product [Eretmochelys imbricata]